MATELKVRAAELTLITVKLSIKILKQIPTIGYDVWRPIQATRGETIRRWKELKEKQKQLGNDDMKVGFEKLPPNEQEECKNMVEWSDPFIGWLHSSLFGVDSYEPRLLVRMGEGKYALYVTTDETVKNLPQIYVS